MLTKQNRETALIHPDPSLQQWNLFPWWVYSGELGSDVKEWMGYQEAFQGQEETDTSLFLDEWKESDFFLCL